MKYELLVRRGWILALLLVAMLMAHGVLLYRLWTRTTVTLGLAIALIVILKHVGILGAVRAAFRNSPKS